MAVTERNITQRHVKNSDMFASLTVVPKAVKQITHTALFMEFALLLPLAMKLLRYAEVMWYPTSVC